MRRVSPRTLGVEEEFHLVDLKTRRLTARAPELLAKLTDDYVAELQRCVVETNTDVVDSLGGLRDELIRRRKVLVESATALRYRSRCRGGGAAGGAGRNAGNANSALPANAGQLPITGA